MKSVSITEAAGARLTSLWGNLWRWIGFVTLVVGIVTAALDKSFGGFTPVVWFLIAIFSFLIVICTEIVLTRLALEKKEK